MSLQTCRNRTAQECNITYRVARKGATSTDKVSRSNVSDHSGNCPGKNGMMPYTRCDETCANVLQTHQNASPTHHHPCVIRCQHPPRMNRANEKLTRRQDGKTHFASNGRRTGESSQFHKGSRGAMDFKNIASPIASTKHRTVHGSLSLKNAISCERTQRYRKVSAGRQGSPRQRWKRTRRVQSDSKGRRFSHGLKNVATPTKGTKHRIVHGSLSLKNAASCERTQ